MSKEKNHTGAWAFVHEYNFDSSSRVKENFDDVFDQAWEAVCAASEQELDDILADIKIASKKGACWEMAYMPAAVCSHNSKEESFKSHLDNLNIGKPLYGVFDIAVSARCVFNEIPDKSRNLIGGPTVRDPYKKMMDLNGRKSWREPKIAGTSSISLKFDG